MTGQSDRLNIVFLTVVQIQKVQKPLLWGGARGPPGRGLIDRSHILGKATYDRILQSGQF